MKIRLKNQLIISYITSLLLVALPFSYCPAKENKFKASASKQESFNTDKFPLKMAIHRFPGCPENSYCNQKAGKKRNHFLNYLNKLPKNKLKAAKKLQSYNLKHGILLPVWLIKHDKKSNIIHWNSHCFFHSKKENKIFVGDVFIKNLNNIPTYESIFTDTGHLLLKSKILKYKIPRGEIPLYIDGANLVFIRDEEQNYFSYQIDQKGHIKIITMKTPPEYPSSLECPESLKKYFSPNVFEKEVYKHYSCKQIWNIKKKKFEIMLLHQACI